MIAHKPLHNSAMTGMQGGNFHEANASTGIHARVISKKLSHKTKRRHHCGVDNIKIGSKKEDTTVRINTQWAGTSRMPSPRLMVHAVARSSIAFQNPNESMPTESATAIVPIIRLGTIT